MKVTKCLTAAALLLPIITKAAYPVFSAPAPKSTTKTPAKKAITRGEIVALKTAMEKATRKRDVNGIVARLAPNAVVKLTIQNYGTFNWNRAQYKAYLEQTFPMIEKYQYKSSNTRITIAPDGQSAHVTATIHETVQMNGATIRGVTNEAVTLQIQGGRTVVTSVTGVARMTH